MNFVIRILFCSRFESFESLDLPSPFHTRFGNFNKLILHFSVRARFRVSADFITSFLFRTRFEVIFLSSSARGLEWFCSSSVRGSTWIFDSLILLSSSARGSKLIFDPLDLFALLDPHSKASQTWFCSGLALENQSNLVLFWSYSWKPVKLGSVSVLH